MKVLHFIPNLKVAAGFGYLKYKLPLLEDMSERVEVHLLTEDASCLPAGSKVVVHKYSPAKLFVGMENRSFKKLLLSLQPDVVHIHACWNLSAYHLLKLCVRKRIHTVLTLDHGMAKWNMSRHYWIGKLLMLMMFQRYMVSHAGAVHAVTGQEADTFRTIDRVVEVDAFNLFGGMTVCDMTDRLLMLYIKVADTTPFVQLTENELRLEDVLLQIGVNHGRVKVQVNDGVPSLNDINEVSWRRMFIHADDEGVLDYLKTGISVMGLSMPDVDVTKIDRFALRNTKAERRRRVKVDKLNRDESLSEIERDLCKTVIDVLWKIRHNCVHRKDFVKLYLALRFNDYDEEKVWQKMCSMRNGRDAQRLLCILGKRYGLGEGFMFTVPLDDSVTHKLEEKLFKSYIQ